MSWRMGDRVRLEEVGTLGTVVAHQWSNQDGVFVRWDGGQVNNVSGAFLLDADWDVAGLESAAVAIESAGWADEADERVIAARALRRAAEKLKEFSNGDR